MKMCIYGVGAMGAHIAGRLAGAPAEVSLIAPAPSRALRLRGACTRRRASRY